MAYAHAGRYGTDSLTRRNGRPVPAGTDVDVYEAGTTTPATLYADRDRTAATNPATVTTLGNLTFFAEPGEYDLLVGSTTLRVVATPDPRDTDAAAAVGTVTSVNGETGTVVLDAADVDAVPTTRTITAGTGLTGGGDLAADRTIAADLSASNGAALGVAAPGVATTIARADHVHPMPSASDVGGIPATIIDAAGDLIIGTAADTAARLAVGTTGQVLTSNGSTAAWAPPPMASIGYVSGAVYTLPGSNASVNYHLAVAAGRWVAHPVWLPAGSYAGLSVLSTVAAVATWRLGIYNGTPDGATTLLHDCGTVNMNATPGSLLASSTFTVPTTGLYWLAVLVDALTAAPTVWSFRGTTSDIPQAPYLGVRLGLAAAMRVYFARYASGVTTGAMPANAPTQLPTDLPPAIRAHAS